MKRESLLILGLVNGIVSAVLFAVALTGVSVSVGDPRTIVAVPYLVTLVLSLVGPVMIGCDLVAALAASYARKSRDSAQLVALIVAACLGAAFVSSNTGYAPAADPVWLVRAAFVAALALPWALGAGVFKAMRKA